MEPFDRGGGLLVIDIRLAWPFSQQSFCIWRHGMAFLEADSEP